MWGGASEQDAEREAGNWDAKNWQDEARKVLERTVSFLCPIPLILIPHPAADGILLEGTRSSAKRDT
jgi:hypothetical protein